MWLATSLALSHLFLYKHGLRRLARVEQVQQEATQNFVLSGIADRDFGDDVLEAFATMNASNVYANFRRFLHRQGTWKFSFCPAQHERDRGDATTIQLYIHGVQAAMIMTEIYVERK